MMAPQPLCFRSCSLASSQDTSAFRRGLASFSSRYSEERYLAPPSATPSADLRERLTIPKCRLLSPLLLPTPVIYLPTSCICRESLRPHRRASLSAIWVRKAAARRPKPHWSHSGPTSPS